MKANGVGESLCKKLYMECKDRFENSLERLQWVEGILIHFGDHGWAGQEYKELQNKVSEETKWTVIFSSRKHRLERRV